MNLVAHMLEKLDKKAFAEQLYKKLKLSPDFQQRVAKLFETVQKLMIRSANLEASVRREIKKIEALQIVQKNYRHGRAVKAD